MENTQEKERAKAQAKAQLETIIEMVEELENAKTDEEREEAQQIIYEDPLSVQVRSGWYNPGDGGEIEEFEILLCTGGPAARLIGKVNEYLEPESVRLEYQDWFTPWIDYPLTNEEEEKVLDYCRQFYYGA